MKTLKKAILISSVIALLAAGCNSKPAPTVSPAPQAQPQAQNPAPAPAPTPAPAGQAQKPLTVYETVQGSNINKPSYQVDAGVSAYDLLIATHVVKAKDFGGGMGMFVESIDGIIPDSKHFWKFFVNGKSSNVGASSYVLKNGDKLEWKLDVISGSN